jgi:hypothetical protein
LGQNEETVSPKAATSPPDSEIDAMANVYRKPVVVNDPKTGKRVKTKSKKWWGRYRDENGVERRVPLATDKTAAQAMLNRLVIATERRSAGVSTGFDEHHKRPLKEHAKDFAKYLPDKGSTPDHVSRTEKRVATVLDGTKTTKIFEMSASRRQSFLGELRDQGRR